MFLDACSSCPDCGAPLKVKGYHTRSFRTLFGTFNLASPKNYLERHFQIPASRLKVMGYGKHRLLALGNDEASHAINRRVEIVRAGNIGKGAEIPAGKEGEGSAAETTRLSLEVGFLYRDEKTERHFPIREDGQTILRTGKNPYQIFFRPDQTSYVYRLQ